MKKPEEQILSQIEDMFSKFSEKKEKIYRDIYDKTIEGNIDLYREEFLITLSYVYVTETLFKIDGDYLTKDDIRENIKYLHINFQDLWLKCLHLAYGPQAVRALIQRAMYARLDVFKKIPVGATVHDATFVGCNASEEDLPKHINYNMESRKNFEKRRSKEVVLLNQPLDGWNANMHIAAYLQQLEKVKMKPLYRERYNTIKDSQFRNLLLQTIRIDLAISIMDEALELNEERMAMFIGILPPVVKGYCLEYASLHDVHDTFTHMKQYLNTQIENVGKWEMRQENRVSFEDTQTSIETQNDNQKDLQDMGKQSSVLKLEEGNSFETYLQNFFFSKEPPFRKIENGAFETFKNSKDLLSSNIDKIEICNYSKG